MACSGKSDWGEILEVLEKISSANCNVAERRNNPSSAGDSLGSGVSLLRNVAVPPIIVFNCVILF